MLIFCLEILMQNGSNAFKGNQKIETLDLTITGVSNLHLSSNLQNKPSGLRPSLIMNNIRNSMGPNASSKYSKQVSFHEFGSIMVDNQVPSSTDTKKPM